MASARFTAPMSCLGRLSVRQRHAALSARCTLRCAPAAAPCTSTCTCTSAARSITTSTSSRAAVSDLTTSVSDAYGPVTPIEEQKVLATIHRFPSLEPLRFQHYPANHLYLPTRRDILHRAVVYEGDNTRLGTASTKTRHEVHGSRRKVRPQKGSGRARLGDKKSPMLRGGGVAFGPKPRDFGTHLPKKVYDLAWRTALSYRFRKGELIIVDNAIELESPSTRLLEDVFKHHQKQLGKGRSLLVTLDERPLLEQALADMDRQEQALTWDEVDVKNLLELSRVIIEREALHNILLTHEEDITHKALTPWHKSLVRSSPPKELESIVGWRDFRDLALSDSTEAEKDLTRATFYENSATSRYTYADTLPQGPRRTEIKVSAYRLLADAKEIHFARATGLTFEEYCRHTSGKSMQKLESQLPKLQALEIQLRIKKERASSLAETSQLESEEATIAVRELEVEHHQVVYDAGLLAAQIHEHRAEAETLEGNRRVGHRTLSLASNHRSLVNSLEQRLLQAKLELANQKLVVAGLSGVGQRKAQDEVEQLTKLLAAKRAKRRSSTVQAEEVDEAQEAEAAALEEIGAPGEEPIAIENLQERPAEAVKMQETPAVSVKTEQVKSQEKR
ncbi:hypothetical protein NX059_001009 [Plenodomus lindquistii]|nr:hypothetical protein NX059_001009 [Plenodomus lindquistii]